MRRAAEPASALRALRALIAAASSAAQTRQLKLQKGCCTNETSGKNLKPIAQEIRTISDGVLHLSTIVATDGVQLGRAFAQLGEQTIKMLEESERTLEGVQNQDLPRSVKEMRDAAEHLKAVKETLQK